MKKKFTLIFVLLLTLLTQAFAQDVTVKGAVSDNLGQPLPGVTVKNKATNAVTVTDVKGNYSITANSDATLVFTFVGFTTQEQKINGRTTVNVTLADANKQLEEVVVIGYGTRAVKDVTGAISSVRAEKLENEHPASTTDIIRGNIPGISVGLNTSAKGGNTGDLQIRGKASLSGNVQPLIVLDGVIYPGQLADINPNDIERVDVLRDPSALAVYGSQSAGGVVAITTKKGKKTSTQITLNANVGVAQLLQNQKYYTGEGFLNWRADGARSSNTSNPYYYYSNPNKLPDGVTLQQFLNGATGDPTTIWLQRLGLFPNEIANYQAGKVTDWSKLIFRNGFRQDYTASLSGSSETVKYYISGNYVKNQNLIQGGQYSDGRIRVNLEGKAAKFLTIGVNAQFGSRDEGATIQTNTYNNIPMSNQAIDATEADWGQIINSSPYGDVYNADGSLRRIDTDDSGLNQRNPFLGQRYNQNVAVQNTLFSVIFARLDLPFGIKYTVNYAPDLEWYRNFFYRPVANPNELSGGTASRSQESRYRYNLDNILSWNKTFGIHNFDATFLLNKERFQSWTTTASNSQLTPTDILGYHNIAAGNLPVLGSSDVVYAGDAIMGRINYTLLNRYIVTATIRRDGFSAFGLAHPREVYPSAAVAWIFSDEPFMKGDAFKWLDYGKLRFSYGANGNRTSTFNPDPSISLAVLGGVKYPTANNSGTITNTNGIYVATLQNAQLKWERTVGPNIGLDFTVLHNRLSGSIDVYDRKTTDLLVKRSILDLQGYNSSGDLVGGSNNSNPFTNIGQVKNRGFEISLDGKIIQSQNFKWSASGTFFLNRNKIVHLYGAFPVTDANGVTTNVEKDDIGNGWFIGHDINAVWDYKILGTWKTEEATDAAKYGAKPGDFKLQDVDGDFKFTNADKQFLGSTNPKFSWSLRNDFNFLGHFDVSFLLVSNIGQLKQYNQALNNPGSVGFARMNSYVLPYWTPDNQINDYARLNSGSSGTTINVWRKNSFVRLQTASIGYTFSKELLKRVGITSAKFFVNASNAAVFSSWPLWDPQNNGPTPRYLSAGFNVVF
ncbi:SusC/RagA family TonB-linked outer membrane protein [Mucilaginibacter celer]|uniref:SusC/RagA family TonB-linked outer membrane protein n=1 Tax=Mucilaginibacter celer TaxID=2305508 RepID=A0A494VQG7_9SPHI|nr:SusC/RagA family TonB-linked outer membrane protein [Mucilaginibacter celer]AYL96609.1 SusC/RagA family TonB-linked outer membrane protein [Mucilaginibacter celer]